MTITKRPILYVDDEEANLRVFKTSFYKDYRILTANSALEGLKILHEKPVELIISDQWMPKMTGFEFLKKAKDIAPDSSRILLSANHDEDIVARAIEEAGLFRHMKKPWERFEMKHSIDMALEVNTLKKGQQDLYREIEHIIDMLYVKDHCLQLSIDMAKQGIWDMKTQTGEVYFSPECYQILEYQPFEFESTYSHWVSMIHRDDQSDAIKQMEQFLDNKIPEFNISYRIGAKSSGYKKILSKGRIVEKTKSGKPLRLTGIMQEIQA